MTRGLAVPNFGPSTSFVAFSTELYPKAVPYFELIYCRSNLGLVFECQSDNEVHVEDRSRLPTSWVASLPQAFSNSGNQPFVQWYKLVKTNSERSLTFATDKLPAIGGAAERIHQITGSVYLAGLWKYVIAQDLLCKY